MELRSNRWLSEIDKPAWIVEEEARNPKAEFWSSFSLTRELLSA
jgi:hypothetical protein